MKSNQQKNNNKRHAAGIIIMFLICTAAMATGCHRSSGDFPHNVTVISGTPTPTPAAAPTDMPSSVAKLTDTPTAFSTSAPTPSSEPTAAFDPTTSPEPTAITAPTGEASFSTPTPTQVPYEGYVIGKDVNNNELKMTPEEADEFVMSGNILKLYDGSWFDIDDDGEPEYVSIQPYGYWEDGKRDQYVVENDGKIENIRLSGQTDQLYHILFSGYDYLPLEIETSYSEGYPKDGDVFVCVTSLNGKTKQIVSLGTITTGGDNWTESAYFVFRTEKKDLVPCGWLGCSILDFQLNDEHRYKGFEVIMNSAVSLFLVVNCEYWFDGIGIKVDFNNIDWSYIDNPKKVCIDSIRLKTIDGNADDYIIAYKGEELKLYDISLNSEVLEAYCYQRNQRDFLCDQKKYTGSLSIIVGDDVDTFFQYYLERINTGEKGKLIEINGIAYSEDKKDNYYGCFGYYGVN